jgi:RNA polymerase sigma-70 factor (ECF subfamily)
MTKDPSHSNPDKPAHWFTTTHWSAVMTAKEADSIEAMAALEKLCQTYWPCLYAYIRREGYSSTDAQDLTQGFFAQLCEKDYLSHLRHQKGCFRSFLLTFLKHFLSDERDKAKAQKRGGGRLHILLDDTQIEDRSWLEPKNEEDPEKLFERRWAHTVLEQPVLEGRYRQYRYDSSRGR